VSTTSVLRRWSAALLAVQESAENLTSAARLASEEGRRSLFGRREYQREGCATARRLADMNAAFVRLHDFVDHGEAQAGPLSLTRLTRQKRSKMRSDTRLEHRGHDRDAYCALQSTLTITSLPRDEWLTAGSRPGSYRILKRRARSLLPSRPVRSFERQSSALCQRPRSMVATMLARSR